jgi:hypothetical protein
MAFDPCDVLLFPHLDRFLKGNALLQRWEREFFSQLDSQRLKKRVKGGRSLAGKFQGELPRQMHLFA